MRHNTKEPCVFAGIILALIALAAVSGCGNVEPDQVLPTIVATVKVYVSEECPYCPKPSQIERYKKLYPRAIFEVIDINKPPGTGVTRVPFFVFCYEDQCRVTKSSAELQTWLEEYCR